MEQYITIPEKTFKKRRRKNTWALIGVGFLVLLGACLLIAAMMEFFATVKPINEISADAIREGDCYYIEELFVVDSYAISNQYDNSSDLIFDKNGTATDWYYIVNFRDKDGTWCYASLWIKKSDTRSAELGEKCLDYVENTLIPLGGLSVSGCFSFQPFRNDKVEGYYKEFYETVLTIDGTCTAWNLTYEGATEEEFLKDSKDGGVILTVFGLAFFLPSLLGFIALISKRRTISTSVPVLSGEALVAKFRKNCKKADVHLWIAFACGAGSLLSLILSFVTKNLDLFMPLYGCLLVGTVFLGVFYFVSSRMSSLCDDQLKAEGLEDVTISLDLDSASFLRENFRCGNKVLLLPGTRILPLNRIAWVYVYETRNMYGGVTDRRLMLHTFDGKRISVSISAEDETVFQELLIACRDAFSPDLIIGIGKDARKRYKELRRM